MADRFRRQLAAGRLPIANCARCCDLRTVDKSRAMRAIDEHRLPGFLMVENTSACNLRCTSCPRTTIRGLRAKPSMSLGDVRKVAGELAACGVGTIATSTWASRSSPSRSSASWRSSAEVNPGIVINTSTNGLVIDSDAKRDAALLMDKMQVSIDGVNQRMVTRYQRGSDFRRAYENMKALVAYRDARGARRPTIIWKYLLFWWNERTANVEQAIEMATEANVDGILFERTVSPLYALPVRSYLGLHDRIGEDVVVGRLVRLRPEIEAGPDSDCVQNAVVAEC